MGHPVFLGMFLWDTQYFLGHFLRATQYFLERFLWANCYFLGHFYGPPSISVFRLVQTIATLSSNKKNGAYSVNMKLLSNAWCDWLCWRWSMYQWSQDQSHTLVSHSSHVWTTIQPTSCHSRLTSETRRCLPGRKRRSEQLGKKKRRLKFVSLLHKITSSLAHWDNGVTTFIRNYAIMLQ